MNYLKINLKNKDRKYYLGIIGINIGIMMIIFMFILNLNDILITPKEYYIAVLYKNYSKKDPIISLI